MPQPKVNLIVAMPTMGRVDLHLATFMYGSMSSAMGFLAIRECLWLNKSFMPVDQARNFLANEIRRRCKEREGWETWVLWTDDDMAPPGDALNKLFVQMLIRPEIDMLAAWMSRRTDSDPGLVFSMGDNHHQLLPGRDFKIGDVVEVGWAPTGFLLHRAELLERIPEPFFKCDTETGAGEDRWFSQQAKKIGARFFVHTGCPVGHAYPEKQKVYWPYGGATNFIEGVPVMENKGGDDTGTHDGVVADTEPIKEVVPAEAVAAMAVRGGTPDVSYTPSPNGHQLKKGIEANVEGQGKDYVCAFLNCDDPTLYSSMVTQFGGAPYVAVLDNGGHLKRFADVPHEHPFAIISTETNIGWGGGVNALMEHVVTNMPNVKAVWVCNDDITGASAEMAQGLYDVMQTLGAAVVSPSLSPASRCSNKIMYNKPETNGGLRRVQYIDFVAPMISVDAWKQVGPLDVETFGWGHGLDVDWTQRAKKLAFPLFIDDSLQITHEHPGTTTDKQGTSTEHMQMGWQRKLIEKYGDSWDKLAEV